MAVIDFPASPSDGQTYTNNGITFVWNNSNGTWDLQASSGGGS